MKIISYRNQVIVLAAWILIVTLLFKLIEDRQVAALIAGSGFVVIPVLILVSEWFGKRNKVHMVIVLIFYMSSALPIFLLRILNWGVDFSTLEILGVPSAVLHRVSNVTYLAVVVSAIVLYRRERALQK